jgi:hypothetical protein
MPRATRKQREWSLAQQAKRGRDRASGSQLALAGGIGEAREAVRAHAGGEREEALGMSLLLRWAGAVDLTRSSSRQ